MKLVEVSVLYDPKTGAAAQALQLPIGKPLVIQQPSLRNTLINKSGTDVRDVKIIKISDKHALPIIFLLCHRPIMKVVKHVTSKEFVNDVKERAEDATETVASGIDQFIRNPPKAAIRLVKATFSTAFKLITSTPGAVKRLVPKPKPQPYLTSEPLGPKPAPKPLQPSPAGARPTPTPTQALNPLNPAAAQAQMPPGMMQQLAAMGFYPPGAARPPASTPSPTPTPAPKPAAIPTTAKPAASGPPAAAQEAAKPVSRNPGPAKGLGAGLGGGLPSRSKAAAEEKVTAAGMAGGLPSRARAAAAPAPLVAATTIEEVEDDDEWKAEAVDEDMEDM